MARHKDTRTDTDAGKELGGVQPGWRFVFRGAEAITLLRGLGEWRALLEAERGEQRRLDGRSAGKEKRKPFAASTHISADERVRHGRRGQGPGNAQTTAKRMNRRGKRPQGKGRKREDCSGLGLPAQAHSGLQRAKPAGAAADASSGRSGVGALQHQAVRHHPRKNGGQQRTEAQQGVTGQRGGLPAAAHALGQHGLREQGQEGTRRVRQTSS